MLWKFWNRKTTREKRIGGTAAPSPVRIFAWPETEELDWAPLTGGTKEILGLQQLIGNQAVLRFMAPRKTERAPASRRS